MVNIPERSVTRWTKSEVGGLDTERFVEPELVTYPSFDGLEVPAVVYKPDTPGPHPVVVSIHGGPEAQYRPYFSTTIQAYVNEMNVAVVAPNVRGSNGYGKSYLDLDNGFLREDSVKDIGALLDWIETQPDLDHDLVAVMGGSYGGYMVLAAMVHYGERLAAAVESVGISNFVTFLENTQAYRQDIRRVEYPVNVSTVADISSKFQVGFDQRRNRAQRCDAVDLLGRHQIHRLKDVRLRPDPQLRRRKVFSV